MSRCNYVLAIALLLCCRTALAGSGAPKQTVVVFAAASLTGAFEVLGKAFEETHNGITVSFNFAGSSMLAQQIQQGAPADVFASADEANVEKLAANGEIAAAPHLFARNKLQIVVGPGNPKQIKGLADLARSDVLLALCGPTLPCGRYAAEAFAKAGLAVPPASQEIDVKGVMGKVMLGEADAGLVYHTDVRMAGSAVAAVDIPDAHNVTARYLVVLLKRSKVSAAEAFVNFVLSREGQRILATFGFLPR